VRRRKKGKKKRRGTTSSRFSRRPRSRSSSEYLSKERKEGKKKRTSRKEKGKENKQEKELLQCLPLLMLAFAREGKREILVERGGKREKEREGQKSSSTSRCVTGIAVRKGPRRRGRP